MIMSEAKELAELIKPTNFNVDVILDIMGSSQKDTLEVSVNWHRFSRTVRMRFWIT